MDHQSFASWHEKVCAVMAKWQQKFIDLHGILDWCHARAKVFGAGTAALSEWLGVQLHLVETRRAGRGAGQSQGSVPRAGKVGWMTGSRRSRAARNLERKGQIRPNCPIGTVETTSWWWKPGSKAQGCTWMLALYKSPIGGKSHRRWGKRLAIGNSKDPGVGV